MEFLIFVALLLIIFLLIGLRSKQKEIAQNNLQSFKALKKELLEMKESGLPAKEVPLTPTDKEVVQWRPYVAPVNIPPKVVPIVPDPEEEVTLVREEPTAPVIVEAATIPVTPINAPVTNKFKKVESKINTESWWGKWLENNPDLEKFVGENLVNKIGIAVLVLGIAFFVKYAIDQNWINEVARVCIGIGCGIILIGIAHYLRNSYRSFSSVMAGGGIAVFYFTIAFAFHEYQLFSQTSAFIIMAIITAFAVALALLYNKIELVVIALVGGFLVPFLVSNGSGNYIVLFSYLLILNVGMLTIAYFKKWPLLHILSFVFTSIIFGGWLIQQYAFRVSALPYKNALLFASAFYLVFFTAVLINNLRTKKQFKAFDFSLVLLITFCYYTEGMVILSEWNNGAYQGIFTIALGVINLSLAWYLYKTQKGDRNLFYLLIGLTLTFISLAAPVQLHGHTITLFWSAECVLLYWLHQKSNITIFKYSSSIILVLMLISLTMDWSIANEKSNTFLPVIFLNLQGIITNIVAVISLGLYAFLIRKEPVNEEYVLSLPNNKVAVLTAVIGVIILYATCVFGINLHFVIQQSFDIPNAYHQIITYLFIASGLLVVKRLKIIENPIFSIVMILAGFVFYLFSNGFADNLMEGIVVKKYASFHGFIHWLSNACLLYLLYQLINIFRSNMIRLNKLFAGLICILFLVFCSIEFRFLYVSLLANTITLKVVETQYIKAGLTIVWALFSFIIMWLGMKHKYKPLRIISLSIFSAALLKLFLFDIINISEGGKIAAFIMLGILLLVISFMYQRLKKIIVDNEEKKM